MFVWRGRGSREGEIREQSTPNGNPRLHDVPWHVPAAGSLVPSDTSTYHRTLDVVREGTNITLGVGYCALFLL